MTADDWRSALGAEVEARRAADRLAVALEEVGFDVGRAFPTLTSTVNREGQPVVDLGSVTLGVAAQLAEVLLQAARQGITATG